MYLNFGALSFRISAYVSASSGRTFLLYQLLFCWYMRICIDSSVHETSRQVASHLDSWHPCQPFDEWRRKWRTCWRSSGEEFADFPGLSLYNRHFSLRSVLFLYVPCLTIFYARMTFWDLRQQFLEAAFETRIGEFLSTFLPMMRWFPQYFFTPFWHSSFFVRYTQTPIVVLICTNFPPSVC